MTTPKGPEMDRMMTSASRRLLDRRQVLKSAAAAPIAAGALGLPFAASRAAAQDVTEVSIWTHTHPPMVELNEDLIAEFNEQNPDINVSYEIVPNMNFAERLLSSVSTGTGPDVINMDDNQMRSIYIPNGLVTPVDPVALGFASMEELEAAYIPGAFQGAELDGQIYGLPSEFNVTAFIINTEAFEEAGLDPDSPPTTWEEVATMGEALVLRDGDNVTRRGFDFLYLHAGWYHNQLGTLLLQTGGRLVSEDGTTAAINQPEAVAALQIWYDMVHTYGIADPNIASREATVPYQDFIDGNVAMSLMNPWGLGLITEESPVFGKYKVVPLPQVDPANPVNPLYAYYWSVVEQSQVKDAAFKLVGFLASHPGAWLDRVEFIQPRAGWDELPEVADFAFYDVWAAELLHGQFQPVVPNSQEVDAIVMSAIENSILNGVPPQEAFDQAAEQINQVLQAG